MTNQKCKNYNSCSAPLCPIDDDSEEDMWYPDEPVCSIVEHSKLPWIHKQKMLARRKVEGYFTIEMLNMLGRTKNIKGANPDKVDDDKHWVRERKKNGLFEATTKKKADSLASGNATTRKSGSKP